VTAEYAVERTGSTQTKRCDIVAFVNGIPVLVIENKRPTESLKKAGSQLIGYQSEDNIPQLFHFAQLLLTMNRVDARYATVGTPQKFWGTWRDEEDSDEAIAPIANRVLTEAEKQPCSPAILPVRGAISTPWPQRGHARFHRKIGPCLRSAGQNGCWT
jgi:type I restriction enzyme R subunit